MIAGNQSLSLSVEALISGGYVPASVTWGCNPATYTVENGVFTAPAVSTSQLVVITATDATDSLSSSYAVVMIVPASTQLNPQFALIAAGQSMTLEASSGVNTDADFSWTLNGEAVQGTSTYTYESSSSVTTVSVNTVSAECSGDTATSYAVVVPANAQTLCMSPVQSATTNNGNPVTFSLSAPEGTSPTLTGINWILLSGRGEGSITQSGETCVYTPPVVDLACPFTAYLLATATDSNTNDPWYGVAMVEVTAAS
jgi:hypothetical protein